MGGYHVGGETNWGVGLSTWGPCSLQGTIGPSLLYIWADRKGGRPLCNIPTRHFVLKAALKGAGSGGFANQEQRIKGRHELAIPFFGLLQSGTLHNH